MPGRPLRLDLILLILGACVSKRTAIKAFSAFGAGINDSKFAVWLSQWCEINQDLSIPHWDVMQFKELPTRMGLEICSLEIGCTTLENLTVPRARIRSDTVA